MAKNNAINILIIEDNEDDLFFIKKALAGNRYNITEVIHSGKDAYEYLLSPGKKHDVVLLDKNLPEMNGLEILQNIQKQKVEQSFIFLTVDKNVNTVITAMKSGALDFIVKSADLKDELPEKIEKIYQIHLNKIEKKNTEEALRKSEGRFRSMFMNAPIAYQSLDKSGRFIDVNERLCQMLGYEPDELLGKSFGDLWPEKYKQSFPGAFEHLKLQGFITADLELVKKDGEPITVILEGRTQTDTKGQFAKTHCILHNITERKLMETALVDQYDFQRLVAIISSSFINLDNESLNDKMYDALNKAGRFYNADRSYVSLFQNNKGTDKINIIYEWCAPGVKSQVKRLQSMPWGKFPWLYEQLKEMSPVNIPVVEDLPKAANAEKEEFKRQNVRSLVCLPMENKNNIIGLLGFYSLKKQNHWSKKQVIQLGVLEKIFTNAILRKQTLDALKESEFRYRTVSDHTYNWEYWIDAKLHILYISPSVERITGYKPEEFKNDPALLEKIIHEEDKLDFQKHRAIANDTKENREFYEAEFRINKKNTGEQRWISHVCRKIFSDEGDFLGFRVSNRDITEKIETEKRLMSITTEVEERERSRFSMEIHDGLGPLLSNIKLYFQWLSETDDPEKAKMITQKGNQSIEVAIQTTREIAYNLSPRILDKFGIFDALQELTQRISETKKIKINFSYNSNIRFEKYTEKTLYYIICELINNTLKHSKATEVNILLKISESNNIISLNYSDNGVGFDVEKAKDLHGTEGLGIWNILQKVKTLRGDITIDSSPGKGMKAYIELEL